MAIPTATSLPSKRSSRTPSLPTPPTPPVSLHQHPPLSKMPQPHSHSHPHSTDRSKRIRISIAKSSQDIMEGVDIPSERVPEGLKACEQILKRAKELKRAEPVVAYWCCFSAAEKVLKVHGRSKEQTMFLMSLLDALEKMKAILANNDAVLNEAAGAAYIENFALKVFMSADNDDRNGITGKATIRKFVVAGQFIEVLKCFENGMTEEMEQKLQYARWKAADGAKALREGREPTSGPPVPEPEDPFPSLPTAAPSDAPQHLASGPPSAEAGPSFPRTSSKDITPIVSPRASPAVGPRRNHLTQIDTSSAEDLRMPGRSHSSGSLAWSTVATPGLADDGEEQHFHVPDPDTTPPASDRRASTPAGKNVRFMGPDGAPLSPAQTHLTVDSYDAPDAPPPTVFDDSPMKDQPTSSSRGRVDSGTSGARQSGNGNGHGVSPPAPGNGSVKPAALGNTRRDSGASARPHGSPLLPPTNGTHPTSAVSGRTRSGSASRPIPGPTSSAPPPAPPPSLAQYPSHPASVLGISAPPPMAPTAPPLSSLPPPSAPVVLSRKQTETVQKHARWAISALEFDDVETARTELRKALAAIGG